MKDEKNDKKGMNLAYGGQALIEGVLMRSPDGYAFTVRKPDKTLHKEYHPYVALGKKMKFFGLPFIRGIAGFCENLCFGMKIINRSAEIAFPEEAASDSKEKKESSAFAMILTYVLAFGLAMLLFVATPYFITGLIKLGPTEKPPYNFSKLADQQNDFDSKLADQQSDFDSKLADQQSDFDSKLADQQSDFDSKLADQQSDFDSKLADQQSDFDSKLADQQSDFDSKLADQQSDFDSNSGKKNKKLDHTVKPFLYNLVAGVIRMFFFFIYLFLISFLEDTKRLFGYHGAEHKTINAYEAEKELSVENVRSSSRLHPRCGTSFVFIVFLITIVIFPFFNIFFNQFGWYLSAHKSLQNLLIIASHIIIGMPIVSSVSYELLKLSAKYEKNPIVKLFVLPGLFFQLFSTREPDDGMIETAISSLQMVIKGENPDE